MFFFSILVVLYVCDFNNHFETQNYIMFEEETAQLQNLISEFNN